MTFEQDEMRWLIRHLQRELKLLSEDIYISKRYDDVEMANRILRKLGGSQGAA